ncbi:DUF2007 domain-containing protein [Aliikangiella marina]|uniref:DUF2007 domain-containing protein n=1 Tax=Aliikangiella marina TaxID=1712262 RepID=A0A545T9U9_9GAMM|nr:DUF2007 domain-containing protein [Aliikangiella marina]TQV73984.1 DUF2007 domain-containing protein [Aliikangiella marina]
MKKVFAHENRLVATNIKNILEAHNIDVMLKNEFASSAIGEISPFDSWIELWVKDVNDYERAASIVANSTENTGKDWLCVDCGENNGAAFDFCWNCQSEPS